MPVEVVGKLACGMADLKGDHMADLKGDHMADLKGDHLTDLAAAA